MPFLAVQQEEPLIICPAPKLPASPETVWEIRAKSRRVNCLVYAIWMRLLGVKADQLRTENTEALFAFPFSQNEAESTIEDIARYFGSIGWTCKVLPYARRQLAIEFFNGEANSCPASSEFDVGYQLPSYAQFLKLREKTSCGRFSLAVWTLTNALLHQLLVRKRLEANARARNRKASKWNPCSVSGEKVALATMYLFLQNHWHCLSKNGKVYISAEPFSLA